MDNTNNERNNEKNANLKYTQLLVTPIDEDDLGINIEFILEIIRLEDITAVPATDDYIEGAVNLRGKIVPVMDLRRIFSIEKAEYTDRTSIVILDYEGEQVGLIVDQAKDVVNVSEDKISPYPVNSNDFKNKYFKSIAECNGMVIHIMDIDKILKVGLK